MREKMQAPEDGAAVCVFLLTHVIYFSLQKLLIHNMIGD
jgi:hypothetical protein